MNEILSIVITWGATCLTMAVGSYIHHRRPMKEWFVKNWFAALIGLFLSSSFVLAVSLLFEFPPEQEHRATDFIRWSVPVFVLGILCSLALQFIWKTRNNGSHL